MALHEPLLDAGLVEGVAAQQRLAGRMSRHRVQSGQAGTASAHEQHRRARHGSAHLRPAHRTIVVHALYLLLRGVLRGHTCTLTVSV